MWVDPYCARCDICGKEKRNTCWCGALHLTGGGWRTYKQPLLESDRHACSRECWDKRNVRP